MLHHVPGDEDWSAVGSLRVSLQREQWQWGRSWGKNEEHHCTGKKAFLCACAYVQFVCSIKGHMTWSFKYVSHDQGTNLWPSKTAHHHTANLLVILLAEILCDYTCTFVCSIWTVGESLGTCLTYTLEHVVYHWWYKLVKCMDFVWNSSYECSS